MDPKIPFQYSYWAVPGKILAGCYPGSVDPGVVREHVSALIDAGVTLIINLMEVSEMELIQMFYQTYESVLSDLAEAGMRPLRMKRFPIRDMSVPTPEQMASILQAIRQELDDRGVVYVHCRGGIGRTGTVIGCYLAEQGLANPLAALHELTASEPEYFWPTPQTEEQQNFVLNWPKMRRCVDRCQG